MKVLRYFLILSIAVLGFTFTSVNAQSYSNNKPSSTLEQKVFKKIITLPYYGVFDHISYKVDGDTVTLYGKVLSLGTKKSAENVVRKIDGVGNVVNNIENLSPSPYDNSIRYGILRRFADAPALYGYLREPNPSVRIIVQGGRVTLEGYVNNRGTANVMNILANGVSGVFSVTNNLVIEKDMK
ncbi:MAG TPA: BON domain-containing protein [Pyrinomonadaceae bacterium]|jgi:hyperosmotically inducible protein